MKRLIIAGTIALLIAITVGSAISQDSILHAFISSDPVSQGVRIVLIGLLTGLLFTQSPRNLDFRTALLVASACLTFGVTVLLSQFYMAAGDALVFIEVAIVLALEAIEAPVTFKPGKKIAITYMPQNEKISI